MNLSIIDKSTDRHSCSTSSFTSRQISIGTDTPRSHNPRPRYFYNSRHHLNIADSIKTIKQELLRPEDWVPFTVLDLRKKFVELPIIDISMIGTVPFNTLVQQASHAKNMESFKISIYNIEKALAPRCTINLAKKLPTKYHDFLDVFSRANSDILPPYRPYDHKISLMEDKTPSSGLMYSISQDELKVSKKYLEENLSKGFIRACSSPATSSGLFDGNPGGGLHFCVDYKQLNAMTIKNRYLFLLIKEILERIYKVKIYSKIEIIAAFNCLYMQ